MVFLDGFLLMFQDLGEYWRSEPKELLNELGFQLKSKWVPDGDDDFFMPEQDCTGIVIDVESPLIRLADTRKKRLG